MYYLLVLGQGLGSNAIAVYGPFSTLSAAQVSAANYAQQGGTAAVMQIQGPATLPATNPLVPQSVSVGQYCVVLGTTSLLGTPSYLGYGGFATQALAQSWIAGNFLSNVNIVVVQTPTM